MFSMKSLTFSCLICALNLHFAQIEVAHDQKGKICSRLPEPQKVAPKAKSCSKVAEHNWERPSVGGGSESDSGSIASSPATQPFLVSSRNAPPH